MSGLWCKLARPFFQQVRHLPKPGKTHRGAYARFTPAVKPNESGLIYRSRACAGHLNLKKSNPRRDRLRRPSVVSKADQRHIEQLLGRKCRR